jgi:acyl-ACP thioesterase
VDSGSGKPSRLPALTEKGTEHFRIVNYSDIDIYQHANNAEYIEWFTDLIPHEYWIDFEPGEITVNYMSECLPGNHIRLNTLELENKRFLFSAYNETLNREVCRGELISKRRMIH